MGRHNEMASRDMRGIAFVTLTVLPETFMAVRNCQPTRHLLHLLLQTLFSTGFLGFSGDGRVVSGWFWLYWLLTAVLTLAVYVGWYMFSNRTHSLSSSHIPTVVNRGKV
jgi:hypothetical protein